MIGILFRALVLSFLIGFAVEFSNLEDPIQGQVGIASFYGNGEKLNKHTASGEVFNPEAMTCAMWDIPFGTRLIVTNLENGKSVQVRVNDWGPNRRLGRLVDLSRAAFSEISSLRRGLIRVAVERMKP